MSTGSDAVIELSDDRRQLRCHGSWTLAGIVSLENCLKSFTEKVAQQVTLDASAIEMMDSAGAFLFQTLTEQLKQLGKSVAVTGVSETYRTLLNLVATEYAGIRQYHFSPPKTPPWLYLIGERTYHKWMMGVAFLSFVGEMMMAFFELIARPRRLAWRLILRNIEDVGYHAMPIVALLIFLVGLVLTYQIALELSSYNANIYIVDITGMVILREFAPLITAIIIAGRTSTAFTAQIGTMKVNEEIDALYTMGVPPIHRLAVPKLIATVVALPLLTVWADVFGVLGSMVMAKIQLDVTFYAYLERFEHTISVRHYIVGLIKAPVFAMIVAAVGCFQGFRVVGTADDVGRRTTHSAVQSIFLIIITDAVFSIIFSWRDI